MATTSSVSNSRRCWSSTGQRQAIATVALFESPEPWTGGVVETDATGKVTAFREKPDPKTISTNLINAGIYLLEPGSAGLHPGGAVFRFREGCVSEIAGGRPAVYATKPLAYIQDVGTPERLTKAQEDFENGLVLK